MVEILFSVKYKKDMFQDSSLDNLMKLNISLVSAYSSNWADAVVLYWAHNFSQVQWTSSCVRNVKIYWHTLSEIPQRRIENNVLKIKCRVLSLNVRRCNFFKSCYALSYFLRPNYLGPLHSPEHTTLIALRLFTNYCCCLQVLTLTFPLILNSKRWLGNRKQNNL